MTPGTTHRFARDEGDTLIEILMTIMVLGITVAGLIAALTLGISSTDAHRRLTNVEVFSRAYGEKIVDQAMHPTSTTLTTATAVGDTQITVASSAGFSNGTTAAVDGEVVNVTGVPTGTTLNVSALTDPHPAGALVTKYQPCPTASDLFVAGFSVPASERVTAPTVSSIQNVEYFDNAGNPVTAANCTNYWNTTALPCSAFASPDHLTECDPPVIRVTLELDSTDVGTTTGASAVTRVLIRRGNA
jgi:hypothetical protein